MKLFDKIKNILFEEEEVEVPVINKEEPVQVEKAEAPKEEPINRFKNINYDEVKVVKEEEPHKAANSPFQQFDEEEFERIAAINKNRLMERDRKLREEKAKVTTSHEDYNYHQVKKEVEVKKTPYEVKHFTPSPVISPVYGILDKNYKKDDILPKASSDGTLPKVMDVDRVRQKAFGTLEQDIEKVITNKPDTLLEEASDDEEIIGDDELVKTAEIKITNFEDQVDEDTTKIVDDEVKEDISLDNVEDVSTDNKIDDMIDEEKNENKTQELKKDDETLESDLFK
jgi:hypothetical protein